MSIRPGPSMSTLGATPSRARAVGALGRTLSALVLTASWSSEAMAGPGTRGIRHMGMGDSGRASATGIDAAITNPSGLGLTQQFALVPGYQINVTDLTHGISAYVLDSLNNPRFGIALAYEFLKGTPMVGYTDAGGEDQDFVLSYFGHEVSGSITIGAVPGSWWFAVTPKFQYSSLRYLDDDGDAIDIAPSLRSFGMDLSTTISLRRVVNLALVAKNLVGNNPPAFTDDNPLVIENVDGLSGNLDTNRVRRLADYPLTLAHSLSIHPTASPTFSLTFDGLWDFSSYRDQDKVRGVLSGGGEYILKNTIPLRAGFKWDGRGRGSDDDRSYASAGLGFIRSPQVGGSGVDFGISFSQQVNQNPDTPRDTVVGMHIGVRIHPDL